eukprot:g7974.t1
MPFYHAKTGKYGRKSIYQVTTKWKDDYENKQAERAERRKLRKEKKKLKKAAALQEHRVHNAEMKQKTKELTQLDHDRRDAKKRIQENNYAVCALRTQRSLKWWRENENKEIALKREQEAQRAAQAKAQKEREAAENVERWRMKMEEENRLVFLSKSRTTNEQRSMRMFGTIEASYLTRNQSDAAGHLSLQSKAAQNMRALELSVLQQKINEFDDLDDVESDSEGDIETGAALGTGADGNDTDSNDGTEMNYIEDGSIYTLSHELNRYPDATSITCKTFGVIGTKLLAEELAPPGAMKKRSITTSTMDDKQIVIATSALSASGGGALSSGSCPVLLELNLNYNSINNKGMIALAKGFYYGATPQLRELRLNSNKIGDTGLLTLVNALNHGAGPHKLRTLTLRNNCLSDCSVVALGHSMLHGTLCKIINLDLKLNRLRDKSARVMLSYATSTACQLDDHDKRGESKARLCINLSGNFIDRKKLRRFMNHDGKSGAPLSVCF